MNSNFYSKDGYWNLFHHQSPSAAITQLQKDIIALEYEAFEGQKGYQPDLWKSLDQARQLARQLWNAALSHNNSKKM